MGLRNQFYLCNTYFMFNFIFRLEDQCARTLAIVLCNSTKVKNAIDEYILLTSGISLNKEMLDRIVIQSADLSKVTTAKILQAAILVELKHISANIIKWIKFHILEGDPTFRLSYICWQPDGMIDDWETAQFLLQNTRFNVTSRFLMAWIYSQIDDIERLWNQMSEQDKAKTKTIAKSPGFKYILRWFTCVSEVDKNKFWRNFEKGWLEGLFKQNEVGILKVHLDRYLPEDRRNKLKSLSLGGGVSYEVFKLYLSLLDDVEKHQLVIRNLKLIIFRYLQWPLQGLFIDLVNSMKDYITEEIFYELLRYILCEKIICKIDDFDYLDVFKYLWNRSSEKEKVYAKKQRMFRYINFLLKKDLCKLYSEFEKDVNSDPTIMAEVNEIPNPTNNIFLIS
ncbi:uncharacterized protein CDAR_368971 [Caerostris darwini]|uniref:Uncharacterized protein n=1 Tax=Caerostris darwini TaxID=1538125 RepID=A0AAV4VM81_9ARAC|nr:uncharacterized protein CDAR_368971 [Caerostris darwini]